MREVESLQFFLLFGTLCTVVIVVIIDSLNILLKLLTNTQKNHWDLKNTLGSQNIRRSQKISPDLEKF